MHAWEAVQITINYIEDHLDDNLEIMSLAELAHLSPFYYQRLFSRLVKKPVKEYIKLRRLAKSCYYLESTDHKILDIALNCGFGSHETFTRAFKEAYGMTPGDFKANPIMMNQFDKPDLLLNYVMIDEGVPLITEGIVLEFNRHEITEPIVFMGFSAYIPIEGQMPLGEATGVDLPGDVWNTFHQNKHSIKRVENGRDLGVAFLGNAPSGSFTYFAGAEIDAKTKDERFEIWELPPREYLVVGFEAENFESLVTATLNKAVKYSQTWLSNHHLISDGYSPEVYYDNSPEGTYMELWIPYMDEP